MTDDTFWIVRAICGPTDGEKNRALLKYYKKEIFKQISYIKAIFNIYNTPISNQRGEKIISVYLKSIGFKKENTFDIYTQYNPFNSDEIIICEPVVIDNDIKFNFWVIPKNLYEQNPNYLYSLKGYTDQIDYYTKKYFSLIDKYISDLFEESHYEASHHSENEEYNISNWFKAFILGLIIITLPVILTACL